VAAESTDPGSALTEEILADAGRQAERTAARARREAQEILDKAKTQADDERRERIEAARQEAERRHRLALATVPVEVGRMRARRTEDLLQSVYDEARRRLPTHEGFDYRATVASLAAEAVARMAGQAFVLVLSEADRQAFGADLAEEVRRRVGREGLRIEVAPEAAPIDGGVIVRDADGRQVWDDSLLGRLDRFWPALRRQVAADLSLDKADDAGPAADAAPKES